MTTPGGAGQPAIPSLPAGPGQAREDEVAEFFAAHCGAIRAYLIGSYVCTGDEADDVVQDSILAVREHWERVRTYEKPVAYWYKVAGRRFRRLQGESAQHESCGDSRELLLATPDPVDAPGTVDNRLTMLTLLRELPLRQRQVVWLRRAADFSEAETARILSIRPGTVKSTLHDAEARLRELLHKSGDTWEAEVR